MNLPAGSSRTAVAIGIAVWLGVVAGRGWGWAATVVGVVLLVGVAVLTRSGGLVVALAVVAGTASGALSAGREAAVLATELPLPPR